MQLPLFSTCNTDLFLYLKKPVSQSVIPITFMNDLTTVILR